MEFRAPVRPPAQGEAEAENAPPLASARDSGDGTVQAAAQEASGGACETGAAAREVLSAASGLSGQSAQRKPGVNAFLARMRAA